jgi:fructokinase
LRIGIDLGGTKIEVIALSDEGHELYRKRVDTPRNDYEKTLHAIQGLINDAEKATGHRGSVGLGIPGTLSPFTGKVKNANSVWLNGQKLDEDLGVKCVSPTTLTAWQFPKLPTALARVRKRYSP